MSQEVRACSALPADESTSGSHAAPGAKARTEAAAACLTGMRALMSAQGQEPQADGTLVISEGPPASAPGRPLPVICAIHAPAAAINLGSRCLSQQPPSTCKFS